MSKYKILLWDVDNTLLDFDVAEDTGVRAVMKHYGIEPTDAYVDLYSRTNDKLWKALELGEIQRQQILDTRFALFFRELGLEVDGPEAERLYRKQLDDSAVLIEGAKEILERLAGDYDQYVITNGVSATQYKRLAMSGLDVFFKDIFVSEDTGYQKPMKEYFDYCMEKMGHPDPAECLVIGDSLTSDMKGGNIAGIDTCWFNRHGKKVKEGIHVDYEIHSLAELYDYL